MTGGGLSESVETCFVRRESRVVGVRVVEGVERSVEGIERGVRDGTVDV